MANIRAVKSGVWSDNTVWSPNAPTSTDDVFASGFTVTVDQNIQVLSINTIGTTGIGGGGNFRPNNGVLMTTNVVAGSTTCVTFTSASPNFFTLVGNITGSLGTDQRYGIQNTSTGIINVIGNSFGGTGGTGTRCHGIVNSSTGIINLTGSVNGSQTNGRGHGIDNTGTAYVVGSAIGGRSSSNAAYGINNTGTVFLLGDCFGGGSGGSGNIGIVNTGSVSMTGNVIGLPGNIGISTNNGTITVSGNIIAQGARGIQISNAANITVYGNVSGGTFDQYYGIDFNTTTTNTTATIFGNVYGGSYATTSMGIIIGAGGNLFVYGDVFAGTASSPGISNNNSAGVIRVFGNAYGSNVSSTYGIANTSTGTIILSGNAIGGRSSTGYGVYNSSTGTLIVSGNAIGGVAGIGAYNNSTGILRVKRAIGNDWGLGYTTAQAAVPGVFSNNQGSQTFVEELQCGPRGQWPTGGVIFFTPNTKATSVFETDTLQNYTLIQSNSADNLLPPISSVRQGEVYDLGMDTGTCIIPPVSSVGFGVPVDNTTGTATLTPTNVWNISSQEITDSQSIGGRLKNTLTANAAEKIVNSFNLN